MTSYILETHPFSWPSLLASSTTRVVATVAEDIGRGVLSGNQE
jgi:hypothetical protein